MIGGCHIKHECYPVRDYSSVRIVDGPNCRMRSINPCGFRRYVVKENNFITCIVVQYLEVPNDGTIFSPGTVRLLT